MKVCGNAPRYYYSAHSDMHNYFISNGSCALEPLTPETLESLALLILEPSTP